MVVGAERNTVVPGGVIGTGSYYNRNLFSRRSGFDVDMISLDCIVTIPVRCGHQDSCLTSRCGRAGDGQRGRIEGQALRKTAHADGGSRHTRNLDGGAIGLANLAIGQALGGDGRGLGGDGQAQGGRSIGLDAVGCRNGHREGARFSGGAGDGQRLGINVGHHVEVFYIGGVNSVQPYRLPDAGACRVEDASRAAHLLAAGH